MPVAEIDGDRIVVHTEYYEKDLIKSVPGSRWSDDRGQWTVPRTWAACLSLRGVFQDRLQAGPNLTMWGNAMHEQYIKPSMDWRLQLDAPGRDDLYGFQRAGVVWLQHVLHPVCMETLGVGGGALLTDEMGTGKTVQTIETIAGLALRGLVPLPVLAVVPNSVKRKWRREIDFWRAQGLKVSIIGGSAKKRREALMEDADVFIIHWEVLRLHTRLAGYGSMRLRKCRACGGDESVGETSCEVHLRELNMMPIRTVILDEAHRMFDPHSKWTRAAWAVGHQPSVQHRLALTGTPLANAIDDLWSLLHFIDPVSHPTKSKYVDMYCLKSWNMWGGLEVIGIRPEKAEEFYRMLDPVMRRMPKELVLPFLPPKVRDIREAEMSTKQAKAYRDMESRMITKLDDGTVVYSTNQLVTNTRLLQFASAYATVNEDGEVKLSEPSSKLDVLDEILQELGWKWATSSTPARQGLHAVVFAESRQLLELAEARMIKHGVRHWLLAGGQSDDIRDVIVQEFNTTPGVLLVVIKAGGEGLDFVAARHVIFLQRSWSMLANKQTEDRCHRIGSEQHNKIEIIDLVAPDTKEVEQIPRLHEKFRRLQEIVRDKVVLQQAGDIAQLQALEAEEAEIMRSELL